MGATRGDCKHDTCHISPARRLKRSCRLYLFAHVKPLAEIKDVL